MFSRSNAGLKAWRGIVVGVAALFAFASAGVAQEGKVDKAKAATPSQQTDKAKKDSPEAQKARAEIKALHEQMSKLHDQMHATREKMHKAWVHLAEVEGWNTKGFAHHRGWRHPRMGFASWGGPDGWHAHWMHGPWMHGPWVHHWARFHDGEMVQHGGGTGQDVGARLQHLQDEIDALRRQLQKQASPRQER